MRTAGGSASCSRTTSRSSASTTSPSRRSPTAADHGRSVDPSARPRSRATAPRTDRGSGASINRRSRSTSRCRPSSSVERPPCPGAAARTQLKSTTGLTHTATTATGGIMSTTPGDRRRHAIALLAASPRSPWATTMTAGAPPQRHDRAASELEERDASAGGTSRTTDPGLTDWQAMADAYMAEHPNVTIEITCRRTRRSRPHSSRSKAETSRPVPVVGRRRPASSRSRPAGPGHHRVRRPWIKPRRRAAVAVQDRWPAVRRPVHARHGRLLVQQGPVRPGRHRGAADHLGRAPRRRAGSSRTPASHRSPSAAGRVAGPLLLRVPHAAHRRLPRP